MRVFPTRLFFFDGQEADLDRRTVSGGVALSGEEDVVATDGGGRVFLELSDPDLSEPDTATAWRAINAAYGAGAAPIIVPLGDARHQHMGDVTTPPGGLPWWEETDYDGEPLSALAAPAALRATTISVSVADLPAPVRPGIWLSIDHATFRHRAYQVADVLDDDGETAVLRIEPPLREATLAGSGIEFVDPKCTMRVEGGMRSPSSLGFASSGVRFVEWPGAVA
jgi:hypothetical protein